MSLIGQSHQFSDQFDNKSVAKAAGWNTFWQVGP
jgi:hypothetical protein